jgi:hypothetical protein
MSDQEFNLGVPFSNLAGSRLGNFIRLIRANGVEKRYWWRAFTTGLVVLILEPFAWIDSLIYRYIIRKKADPDEVVFVIGHWRSGTTHLHKLLCMDDKAGFTSTYQTVFPNHMFFLRFLLKPVMRWFIPPRRPVDRVPLNADFPQEEDFGLGSVQPLNYYNFFYFPVNWKRFFKHDLCLDDLTETELNRWKRQYRKFIIRGLTLQQRSRYVSKNPPNTARIKVLTEMFPHARFIFIHRNPYEVIQSTWKFIEAIRVSIQFQDILPRVSRDHILEAYGILYDTYHRDKSLIPGQNLVEIAYDELISDPLQQLEKIYRHFGWKITDDLQKHWQEAINNESHKENKYDFTPDEIKEVNKALGTRIIELGYESINPGHTDH